MMAARTKATLDILGTGRISAPLELKAGKEAEQFQLIKPAKDLQGVAAATEIKPVTTFGIWYPSPPPKGSNGSVAIHFHGGAYVSLTARNDSCGWGADMLAKHVADFAFLAEYRLASREDGAFPAQLQDAIAAYQHVLSLGIEASQIVVGGDSAGGHLTLSLLRYIVDNDGILPQPRAALLWSPAVDWVSPSDVTTTYNNKHYNFDIIPAEWIAWGSTEFTKGLDPSAPSLKPYLVPLHSPFRIKTPLWIQACGLEVLHDSIVEFGDGMKAIGNSVTMNSAPLAVHDLFYGNLTGFLAEADKAFKEAGAWLEQI